MSKPIISVIFPVYNVEAYLRESLDCLIHQTLTDLEIICVDDGSPDNSIQILEEYAARDSRIRILRQTNQGLSMARNNGAAMACGTWLYFMDSDDTIEPDALEAVVNYGNTHDLDMVFFDTDVYADSPIWKDHAASLYENSYRMPRPYPDVYTGMEYYRMKHEDGLFINNVWLFILRADFYRNAGLSFVPGLLMEDAPFHLDALLHASRVGRVNRILYHYRIRSNSILSSRVSGKFAASQFVVTEEMLRIADAHQVPEDFYPVLAKDIAKVIGYHLWSRSQVAEDDTLDLPLLTLPDRIRMEVLQHVAQNPLDPGIGDLYRLHQSTLQEYQELAGKYNALAAEHLRLQTTLSYRLGRAITALPRKIKQKVKR